MQAACFPFFSFPTSLLNPIKFMSYFVSNPNAQHLSSGKLFTGHSKLCTALSKRSVIAAMS